MFCPVRNFFLPAVVLIAGIFTAQSQFAPVAGLPGSTAIPGDSSIFIEWASGCTVQRGPVNIADTSLGVAGAGVDPDALGPSDDVTVSLGDGGTAVVTFAHPIYNGDGFDFAVFENGFMTNDSNMAFLELGFVEVSTDGIHFVRFPAVTHVEDTVQFSNDSSMDGGQVYDFAGKYIGRYGTPFDLQELVDSPGIDVNNINYVKIIDVVGSIDSAYATYDHNGHIVNDPWPTPYPSCGFDLDAVGVINAIGITGIENVADANIQVFPNPVRQGSACHVRLPEGVYNIQVFDVDGRLMSQIPAIAGTQTISTNNLSCGIYFIHVESANASYNAKLIVE